MDKPHLTFLILSHLILLLSPSDLLIRSLLYVPRSRLKFKGDRAFAVVAHGYGISCHLTLRVLRLFRLLSIDLKNASLFYGLS